MADQPTVADFQPTTVADFQPNADEQPSITKHDPETYAALTVQNATKDFQQQGLSPYVTGDTLLGIHNNALQKAQDFKADIAKTEAAKALELQQRQVAAQRPAEGQPSLLEKEEQERSGVALMKEQALRQSAEGADAAAESAALAKPGQPGPYIKALPDDQVQRLEHLDNAYDALNNMQKLHANVLDSALGAGGNVRSLIGDVIKTGQTSGPARALEAYTDESLTPLAVGILGDKASGATKANIQDQLRGTIPDRGDTLGSAGNKIYLMKMNIIKQLDTMQQMNQGRYATAKINSLYQNLNQDFTSPDVKKWNPINPSTAAPVVNVGNSPEGKAQVATAASAGATPAPDPAVTPVPGQQQPQGPTPNQGGIPSVQQQASGQQAQPFDLNKFLFGGFGS